MSQNSFRENLYLKFGCFGLIEDNFVSCSSCENKILKIHTGLECYGDLMDYLDTCKLFDKPSFDYNAIRSIIQNIQYKFDYASIGKPIWHEKDIARFEKFTKIHKPCGLYLKLSISEEETSQIVEKSVKITSLKSKEENKPKKINLKISRTWR